MCRSLRNLPSRMLRNLPGVCLLLAAVLTSPPAATRAQTPRLMPARGAADRGDWKSQTRVADARRPGAGKPIETEVSDTPAADVTLPNSAGQVWREYDLRPYTTRVEGEERPEIAVKDWILRETGTEAWFHEPLGMLAVSRDKVRVYHTPDMQRIVKDVVEKFVTGRPEPHAIGMRLMTLQSPNWRTKALPLMEPVEVHSPGVEAWLISRENAVILLSDLRRRADFREISAGEIPLYNGQPYVINRRQPRKYIKSVRSVRDPWPAHQPQMGEIDEGYTLEISSLFDERDQMIDTVVRCNVDQVEQLVPVTLDLPGFVNQRQRIDIHVPQLVSWRLHERFVWPEDRVLVLSCGVVATPGPQRTGLSAAIGLPSAVRTPFDGPKGRADALLMIEHNGTASQATTRTDRSARSAPNNHGRY